VTASISSRRPTAASSASRARRPASSEGPALKGATNLVLGAVDHRETAHPRAFREIYKFIAGREPSRIEIVPKLKQAERAGDGTPGGVKPPSVSGATVEIIVSPPIPASGSVDPCIRRRPARYRWGWPGR
jgi:hypothetical protein